MNPQYKNLSIRDLEAAATRSGIRSRNGHGDHKVFQNPRTGECMPYCNREMGLGLKCKIIKWLLKAGVVFTFFLGLLSLIGMTQ